MLEPKGPRPRPRVLVIDDDPLVRRALEGALDRVGFAVTSAPCAPPPDTAPFDVGVFDVRLRNRDGVRLAQNLLDARMVREAIFFTGTREDAELERAARVGTIVGKTEPRALIRELQARTRRP